MPLFGKKKTTTKGATGASAYPIQKQQPAYPSQQPAYPSQQPAYPSQQPAYPTQKPVYPKQQPVYSTQKPLYPTQQQPGAYCSLPPYSPGYPNQYTQQPYAAQPIPVSGMYDQGARFDPNRPPSVPPPPPGVAPTQAQIAVAQGQSVFMTQQKKDFWGGGSDGGTVLF